MNMLLLLYSYDFKEFYVSEENHEWKIPVEEAYFYFSVNQMKQYSSIIGYMLYKQS
jgi:hypothetical protein